MEDWIRIFLNNYINGLYFPTVHLTDVIEILIITVIVYEIMLWTQSLNEELRQNQNEPEDDLSLTKSLGDLWTKKPGSGE